MAELKVERIQNGTVIDHIPAGMGWRVLQLLNLTGNQNTVALLMNVPSKKLGKKDIVKVAERQLDEKDVNRIALIAPNATLNLVKNGAVAEKSEVRIPGEVRGVGKCPNPRCITNTEGQATRFVKEETALRCAYCENLFEAKELVG